MGEFDVRERTASEVEAGQVAAAGPAQPEDRRRLIMVNVMLVMLAFGVLMALLTIGLVVVGMGG